MAKTKACKNCQGRGLFPFCRRCYRDENGRDIKIIRTKQEQHELDLLERRMTKENYIQNSDNERRESIQRERDRESIKDLSKMLFNMEKAGMETENTFIEQSLNNLLEEQ